MLLFAAVWNNAILPEERSARIRYYKYICEMKMDDAEKRKSNFFYERKKMCTL